MGLNFSKPIRRNNTLRLNKIRTILLSLFPEHKVKAGTNWESSSPADSLRHPLWPNTIEDDELLVFALARWLSTLDEDVLEAKHSHSIGKTDLASLDLTLPREECSHWSKLSTWKIEEASLLSLGIVPSEALIDFFDSASKTGWAHPITRQYSKRNKLTANAIEANEIQAII